MALYDTRVFKAEGHWWIGQVHGNFGSGFGDAFEPHRETVYFTCASDQERNSVVIDIPAGTLNRMNHRSIIRALEVAKPFGHRLPMSPANAPDIEQLEKERPFTDDDGLRWVVNRSEISWLTEGQAGVKVSYRGVCLDNSALTGLVGVDDPEVVPAKEVVIRMIKDQFQDVQPLQLT